MRLGATTTGTHPRTMNSVFIRPFGGWKGRRRMAMPNAAPIHTAQSISLPAPPSRALRASGVAQVAMSRKMAAWSHR